MAAGSDQTPSKAAAELVLVPTLLELELLREFWPHSLPPHKLVVQAAQSSAIHSESLGLSCAVCGFGLVTSAAQASLLIQRLNPRRVWLLGIAGAYPGCAKMGQAICFSTVACYGIGVGTGSQFQSAESIGWRQWQPGDPAQGFGDQLCLRPLTEFQTEEQVLLSVTAAAQNHQDVELRQRFCPAAVAEDMEGFAVAAACRMSQIPLIILRGISNQAGDRNKSNWRIRDAMQAVTELFGHHWTSNPIEI